jgi:hypothetical protein
MDKGKWIFALVLFVVFVLAALTARLVENKTPVKNLIA